MDVTWEGVPNALARILEVNLGIIAACAPTMKPFVRYMHARATGKDPREALLRTSTRYPSHSHWYTRFRFGSRAAGSASARSGHNNVLFNPSPQPPAEVTTTQSLGLPLQGFRETETDDGFDLSTLRGENSQGSLQTHAGEKYPSKSGIC